MSKVIFGGCKSWGNCLKLITNKTLTIHVITWPFILSLLSAYRFQYQDTNAFVFQPKRLFIYISPSEISISRLLFFMLNKNIHTIERPLACTITFLLRQSFMVITVFYGGKCFHFHRLLLIKFRVRRGNLSRCHNRIQFFGPRTINAQWSTGAAVCNLIVSRDMQYSRGPNQKSPVILRIKIVQISHSIKTDWIINF